MPCIRSVFRLAAAATMIGGSAVAAQAGSLADCHRPPPAWYTAPRVSYTYSQSWGSGYSHASARDYSSYRHSSVRYYDSRHASNGYAYSRW